MFELFAWIFAAVLGLSLGSFLNVCVWRWPRGESIVRPGSHCPCCGHVLAWWENLPLLSWLILRARCRGCHQPISVRYPLLELLLGLLGVLALAPSMRMLLDLAVIPHAIQLALLAGLARLAFYWILVALAVLDAEHLWLPDWLTLGGAALGVLVHGGSWLAVAQSLCAAVAGAGLLWLVRWSYWLVRRREGLGLGDVKLMALLGAWLGFGQTMVALVAALGMAMLAALIVLGLPALRRSATAEEASPSWSASALPLGTFLCVGGIVASLWGDSLLALYLRWVAI